MTKTALTGINPAVRQKLLPSGHYREMPDGQLRSEHLYSNREKIKRHPDGLPRLIAGSVDDIKPGSSNASFLSVYFALMAASWEEWYKGLEDCVRVEEPGNPPVYIVDNHRIAYYGWYEARAMGYIQDGAMLIHIDKHSDDKYPLILEKGSNLRFYAGYALNELKAWNFIIPAVYHGLIGQFWDFKVKPGKGLSLDVLGKLKSTTSEVRNDGGLLNFFTVNPCPKSFPQERETTLGDLLSRHTDPRKLIIDIDLDAVVPLYGGNDSVFDQAAAFLAEIARKGGVVTIATSPGYADQNLAIPLARDLTRRIIG